MGLAYSNTWRILVNGIGGREMKSGGGSRAAHQAVVVIK